jgi:short subunit dehydrogenase-like uncharacterized protein
VWGEVFNAAGERAVARLRGPETYDFTVKTALSIVQRVLDGKTALGFQTPSTLLGADFVLSIEGVVREDGAQ